VAAARLVGEAGDRVDNDGRRLKPLHLAVDGRQMHLETMRRRAAGVEPQETTLYGCVQVHPDRTHVAHDLLRRFLESEVDGAPAALAGRLEEAGGNARLPRTGHAGNQDAAATVETLAAEHLVQTA